MIPGDPATARCTAEQQTPHFRPRLKVQTNDLSVTLWVVTGCVVREPRRPQGREVHSARSSLVRRCPWIGAARSCFARTGCLTARQGVAHRERGTALTAKPSASALLAGPRPAPRPHPQRPSPRCLDAAGACACQTCRLRLRDVEGLRLVVGIGPDRPPTDRRSAGLCPTERLRTRFALARQPTEHNRGRINRRAGVATGHG